MIAFFVRTTMTTTVSGTERYTELRATVSGGSTPDELVSGLTELG